MSEFLNDNTKEVMEIFMNLFEEDNYLVKREGMRFLQEILMDSESNKEFYNYFIGEKAHLKFVMQSLNDDSTAITVEAFYILLMFLKAPSEVRGPRVNETLRKNKEPLLQFVQEFNPKNSDSAKSSPEKEDERLTQQKEEAIDEIEMIT